MLDKKTIRRFEKRLRAQEAELEASLELTDKVESRESLTEAIQELSAYDNHPADLGTETYEREKDLGLLNCKRYNYQMIRQALARIKEGKYGVCSLCGRPIDQERLEAVPQAVNCVDCQHQMEQEGREGGYHPFKEILPPYPFGEAFEDDKDNPGITGVDVWRKVAVYGTSESPQDLGGGESYDEMYSTEPLGVVSEVEKEQVREEVSGQKS